MKRAEHQKREALLYAKYLRSQNSILKDDGLLVAASEYDNVSKRYAQEAQKWNDEVKKLSAYDSKQEDFSKTLSFLALTLGRRCAYEDRKNDHCGPNRGG